MTRLATEVGYAFDKTELPPLEAQVAVLVCLDSSPARQTNTFTPEGLFLTLDLLRTASMIDLGLSP